MNGHPALAHLNELVGTIQLLIVPFSVSRIHDEYFFQDLGIPN
jgi:hypothetical protein